MAVLKNQINRIATGYLALLRGKVGGQGPKEFSDVVQPVLDVGPFLRSSAMRSESSSTTGAVGVAPAQIDFDIPNDTAWYVHFISGIIWGETAVAADQSATSALEIINLPDADGAIQINTVGLAVLEPRSGTMATGGYVLYQPNNSFILPPGVTVRIRDLVNDITAYQWSHRITVCYTPLKV